MNNTYLYVILVLLLIYIITSHLNFKKGLRKMGLIPLHSHNNIEKFNNSDNEKRKLVKQEKEEKEEKEEKGKNDCNSSLSNKLKCINNNLNVLKDQRFKFKENAEMTSDKKNSKTKYLKKFNDALSYNDDLNYKNSDEEKNTLDKINKIKEQIHHLEQQKIFKDNYMADIGNNSITSLQNGLDLSVNRIPKTNKYQINLNNGCLSIDSVGNYFTTECDKDAETQHFYMSKIKNNKMYQSQLYPNLPPNVNLTDINYPFSIVKSVKNKNCLQNNHNNISVVPCRAKKSQRWIGSNKKIKCSEY